MVNIVILGAGFGGLQAALTLSKKLKKHDLWEKYSVILVDKNPFHTFTPLLYEIAATSPETASDLKLQELVSFPIESLIAYRHIDFINDEVAGVEMERKKIRLSRSEIDFEYLIIALGAEVNYFDIPGLQKHALPLKTFGDSIRIRDRIAEIFRSSGKNARVVIGGGGSTGVELAGEIKEWIPELRKECSSECGAEITIIESNPHILANLDERVIKRAERRLQKIGVSIIPNTKITKIDDKKTIHLENGNHIEGDVIIWTGGVKANGLFEKRIEVPETTELKDGVYAIGDISRMAPLMARPAIIQGRIAAKNIFQKILIEEGFEEKTERNFYKNRNYPYIIPVGGKYAVAKIGPFVISGIAAWIFKGLTELNYFLSIMPPLQAIKVWFRGFLIFIKNDRLG